MAIVAIAAAMIAVDIPNRASAQGDDETAGRIVARLLDDGRVEFGWQPTGGERVLPRQRYFPVDATVDRWLRSSPVEVDGVEIGRINARLLSGGRIEFGFTPTDGERILTRARYFPTDAQVNRWLRSTEITISAPVAPGFIAVSASDNHACAIRNRGEIACWGWNGIHLYGPETGETTYIETGQATPPEGAFIAVSTGDYHTCAIRDIGEIACWGANDYGETDAPAGRFRAISADQLHTCAIRESGEIQCWGRSTYPGFLDGVGVSAFGGEKLTGSFTAVSTAGSWNCALRESGEIACWGYAPLYADADFEPPPTPPAGVFTTVSAEDNHACAIRTNGAIECWGTDDQGETNAPDGRFTAVSVGYRSACGLRETGAIECWGDYYGEPPEGSFTAISNSDVSACAIRESGAIACWGSSAVSQDVPRR